jgi:voltage-gated potassium channel
VPQPKGPWQYTTPGKMQSVARVIYLHIAAVTWPAVGIIATGHFLSSWFMMAAVEGPEIGAASVYWYFYLVTATTVGYGDLSPITSAGRAITVFWVMPGGIAIFTSIVAKVVQSTASYWRRRMLGLGNYSDHAGHTVILGWSGDNTRKMVAHMRSDHPDREIILASYRLTENPMTDQIQFVRGETLTSDDLLHRSGIQSAGRVLVVGQDDNETLATCLAVVARSADVHLVAFFDDESIADLLKAHCSTAECLVPMAAEMLVRTADDPGSSRIPKVLFSTLQGPTLYSLTVPLDALPMSYGALFQVLKQRHHTTALGIASGAGASEMTLNPADERVVHPGETLYYMAEARLDPYAIAWAQITQDTSDALRQGTS